MPRRYIAIWLPAILMSSLSFAIDRGTCPSEMPPVGSIPKTVHKATKVGEKGVETVYVLTVISDTGYVCSVRALEGSSKEHQKSAEDAIRKWKFRPAMKGGRQVPVVVTVAVTFRANGQGEVSPHLEQPTPNPDKN